MKDYKKAKDEIKDLIEKGIEMGKCLFRDKNTGKCEHLPEFVAQYEPWYTKSLSVIKQITPDRLQDFTMLYSNPKRKNLTLSNYCISDAIKGTEDYFLNYGPWSASISIGQQLGMLKACLESFDSQVYNIQTILQADIFDSEIESAKYLVQKGFLRAAGAICGVVLEKHLAWVCKNHNIDIKKKTPHISDFNDALKDNVYDVVEWRRIQHLGDIRNLCDHNKDREPTKMDLEDLISGTERVTKNIF